MSQTITQRLITLVVAAVLPVLIFAGIMVWRYAEVADQNYQVEMQATAQAISLAVQREIKLQEATLITLSASPSLDAKDWQSFYTQAVAAAGPDGRIMLADAAGQDVVDTRVPFGTPVPPSEPQSIPPEILKSGAPIVSDLAPGRAQGIWRLGVYVPVLRDGRVVFVLEMRFLPARIERVLHEQQLPAGWAASVLDRNGRFVASSRDDLLPIGKISSPGPLAVIRAQPEGLIHATRPNGTPVRAVFVRLSDNNWTVVLGSAESDFGEPLWHSLFILGGGGATLLGLGLALAIVFGQRIARPIRALSEAATALGRGDAPRQADDPGVKEVRDVGDEIVAAAERLKQRAAERETLLATLEQRVAQRTQALTDSEARYRLIADNSADLILLLDREGIRRYVSPSSRRLLGIEPEVMIGPNAPSRLHPDDRTRTGIARLIDHTVDETTDQFRLRHQDGRYIWVERNARAVHDPVTGEGTGWVSVIRDISLRKAAEERAAQAMEQAERASRAKSEFLASMSHELRTPLNAVMGFAQLLQYNPEQELTEKQREYVSYILRGGNHLLELIKDVLDLAKIEVGTLSVSLEQIDLARLMEEIATTLGPMAVQQKGLSFSVVASSSSLPPVKADRARLLQVLINLGSNAVKYNRPGGAITIGAELTGDGWVRVTVADTGIGISAARQAEVFQPFNRLGAERGTIEGTGIGLSISRRLMELMNGRIDFSSEEGVGSRFWVDLPVAAEEQPASQPDSEPSGVDVPAGPEVTVLYIEDNPASLTLMIRLVDSLPNARILTAPTGEIGVALAIAHRPTIVIVDIHLPDISGYDVLERLRATPETSAIPIVALSADALPRDIQKARLAGFQEYLTKPVIVTRMVEIIGEAARARLH